MSGTVTAGGAPVALPIAIPAGGTLEWLAPTVTAVLERAGGTTFRLGADGIAALVTARTPAEFDVVLELTPGALTLRVWGLERRYPLPAEDARAASDAALRALGHWLALLGGESRLVIYHRGGAACCWTVVREGDPSAADRGWHPRTPPARLTRWLRRWRRQVLVNRFLDPESVRALRERGAQESAAHAASRHAAAERDARAALAPVAAA